MRSVSALVKPAMVATASTAKIAVASGWGRRLAASQAIGAPRISRNAVGEPNSQNEYGRREAMPSS